MDVYISKGGPFNESSKEIAIESYHASGIIIRARGNITCTQTSQRALILARAAFVALELARRECRDVALLQTPRCISEYLPGINGLDLSRAPMMGYFASERVARRAVKNIQLVIENSILGKTSRFALFDADFLSPE